MRYVTDAAWDLGLRCPVSETVAVPIVGDQRHVPLPAHWLAINGVARQSDGEPLLKMTLGELQHVDRWYREGRGYLRDEWRFPHARPVAVDWRVMAGMPKYYLLEEQPGALTLFPKLPLNTQDTLAVAVARTYDLDLKWERLASGVNPPVDIPVPDHYRDALVAGACARAYRKRDPDTFDEALARANEAEFTARVGPVASFASLDAQARWAGGVAEFVPNTRFVL